MNFEKIIQAGNDRVKKQEICVHEYKLKEVNGKSAIVCDLCNHFAFYGSDYHKSLYLSNSKITETKRFWRNDRHINKENFHYEAVKIGIYGKDRFQQFLSIPGRAVEFIVTNIDFIRILEDRTVYRYSVKYDVITKENWD